MRVFPSLRVLPRLAVALAMAFAFAGELRAAGEPTYAQKHLESIHRYSMRVWDSTHGLPRSVILSMAQTADGYLWLGTEASLVRFDGTEFESYSKETAPGFLGGHVNALLPEADGTLWIGSAGGLTMLRQGRFTSRLLAFVNSIARDRNGALWVATADGLVCIDGARTKRYGVGEGLPAKRVLSVATAGDGSVWAGTDSGVAVLDGGAFRAVEELRDDAIRAILPTSDGRIWIGTASRGLFVVDRTGIVSHWTMRDGLASDAVYALRQDREGAIWIGTNGGGISRHRHGRFENVTSADGLPSDLAWTLLEDREGAMWAGANGGGLVRLSRGTFAAITSRGGISADIILPIYEDAAGDVWVGTAGAGVNRLHEGQWTHYDVPGKVVLTISGDRRGNVWIGTPQGLTRIRDGVQRHFTTADGLPSRIVSALYESGDGTLWIGTNGGGVARMRNDSIVRVASTREGLSHDSIHCFLEHDGAMWVGTRGGGINRIFADGRVDRLATPKSWPSGIVYSLFRDRRGGVWIGRDGGVSHYDDGRFTDLGTAHGLPEDGVPAVLQDDEGGYWLTTSRGIFHAPEQAIRAFVTGKNREPGLIRFGTSDGMGSAECNGGVFPAALKSRDGTLWFPTIRGIAITDGEMRRTSIAPRSIITAVTVDHVPVAQTVLQSSSMLELGTGSHRIEVRYGAASFDAAEQVTYQYRLDGADEAWVDAGTTKAAAYAHLPAGDYRFRVRARLRHGPWSESPASVAFSIAPLWYRTWWFFALVLIVLAGALGMSVRARVRGLRLETQILHARVEERERAAAALRESEAHFRSLIENAGDLIIIVNHDWIVEYVSPSVVRLLGFTEDLLEQKPLDAFIHPQDLLTERSVLLQNLTTVGSADFRLRHRDGTWRAFHALVQRVDLHWLSSGILLTCRDVTERQLLQRQLEQAHRVASLGRLAATVAHEFNNVLMGIQPFAELIERSPDDARKTREYGSRIAESARRGRRISELIVRYTRDLELQIVTFELSAWMSELTSELRALLPSSIALSVKPPDYPVWIAGDPPLLTQVFVNMALNARDAMPQGGKLEIRTDETFTNPNLSRGGRLVPSLKITFADTGKGISADALPHIFEPLFTTKKASGTGLGLSIAHHIVTKHGGAIYVDSLEGFGTTFHILLPQVEAPPCRVEVEEVRDAGRFAPAKVLLIEDDETVAEALSVILGCEGYEVEVLHTGIGAEEAFVRVQPDLVILDIGLPDVSGEVVLGRLLAIDPDLRVIVSTGHGVGLRLQHRTVEILQKPYDMDTLLRAVQERLAVPA